MEKFKQISQTIVSTIGWSVLAGIMIFSAWFGLSWLSGDQLIIGALSVLFMTLVFIFWLGLRFHWVYAVYGFGFLGFFGLAGALFGLDYLATVGLPANLTLFPLHGALYPLLGMVYCLGLLVILTPLIVIACSHPKEKWRYGGCTVGCLGVVFATVYVANLIFPIV